MKPVKTAYFYVPQADTVCSQRVKKQTFVSLNILLDASMIKAKIIPYLFWLIIN